MMRGFFGIGIYNPKMDVNVGGLYRHAFNFGAAYAFIIGGRYRRTAADTVAAARHLPVFEFKDTESFFNSIPVGAVVCGVELDDGAELLDDFMHPQRAVYLLGAEDTGLDEATMRRCDRLIRINTHYSMNVASAAAIVMYDRQAKARHTIYVPRFDKEMEQ